MMISHEAVNKIESLKRGAFGILPVLCPAKCQGERVESWKRGLFIKAGLPRARSLEWFHAPAVLWSR